MVSLCGSPPAGFFELIGVSLIIAVIFLGFTHYKAYKTDYYNEEYVYFSDGKKVLLYLLFLALNLCVLPLLLLLVVSLYAGLN
ncbi:hypothetical protein [Flavobacterium mesophilum]|uniref:hypothetical protein n=1 Tax=Flavobacterium mesophilum TaxID=3143495 RepID=UPI0031D19F31